MITDLKDFQKLLKICRAQGITELDLHGLKVKFGELPMTVGQTQDIPTETGNPYANFPQGELTPEQLMFYSAGGKPDEDPLNKDAAI